MRRVGLGMVFGMLLAALVFGAYSFGEKRQTHAEGTWKIKTFISVENNDGTHEKNPDAFVNDWLDTIPASCQVAPIYLDFGTDPDTGAHRPWAVHFYYACP